MKISVLIIENAKQIMLTPENDHEKQALKMIAPEDKIEAVTKWGQYTGEQEHAGIKIEQNQAGYYREFTDNQSLMFLITEKKKDKKTL